MYTTQNTSITIAAYPKCAVVIMNSLENGDVDVEFFSGTPQACKAMAAMMECIISEGTNKGGLMLLREQVEAIL